MNPADFTDHEFDEQAAAWLVEREEGFEPEREKEFAAWRSADPRHDAALERAARIMGRLAELAPQTNFAPVVALATSKPRHARRLAWSALGLAAAAAVVLVGLRWRTELLSARAATASVAVADDTSVQRCVALNDGSIVDLNVGARMETHFDAQARRVTLTTGEAHFQVAHQSNRPFLVQVGRVTVRAVGTAFTVRIVDDRVDVIVTDGVVAVERAEASAPAVRAGERARITLGTDDESVQVDAIAPAAMQAELAWQERTKVFRDVPLREIVNQMNRRNRTQVKLADRETGDRAFGGVVALDRVELFVNLLVQEGDIVIEMRTAQLIVLRGI